MAESKFTKGPWKVLHYSGACRVRTIVAGCKELAVVRNAHMHLAEVEANAELMADAPRLLEVLDTLYDCIDHEKLLPSQLDDYHRARELLAKHGG